MDGERADIYLHDLIFSPSVRAEFATAVGSLSGSSKVKIEIAAIKYKGVGRQAVVYGGVTDKSTIDIDDVDIHINLDSDLGRLTNALPENIRQTRSVESVIINGKEVIR